MNYVLNNEKVTKLLEIAVLKFTEVHGSLGCSSRARNNLVNNGLWDAVVAETSFLDEDARAVERIYCYVNDIQHKPMCPVCSKVLGFRFFQDGYAQYCSQSCSGVVKMEKYNYDPQYEQSRNSRNNYESLRQYYMTDEGKAMRVACGLRSISNLNRRSRFELYVEPYLKALGFEADTQIVANGVKRRPDFHHSVLKLIVELDGSIHRHEDRASHDQAIDKAFTEDGYTVIRCAHEDDIEPRVLLEQVVDRLKDRVPDLQALSNVVYHDTEVEVICSNKKDVHILGWYYSRPGLKLEDIDFMEVAKLDVPVNELSQLTMTVYGPIIVRELITAMRDHSLWSRTSRVENLSDQIHVSSFYNEDPWYYLEILEDIQKDKNAGIQQDQFRLRLPITTMCGFTTTLPFRTWIKLIKFTIKMAEDAQQDPTKRMLLDFAYKVRSAIQEQYSLDDDQIKQIIDSYSYANYLSKLESWEEFSVRSGNFVVTAAEIKFSLYAQLVRHRTINFVSNMYELLTGDVEKVTQDSPVKMEISTTAQMWSSIVKKRMCWVAHAELWAPLIKQSADLFGEKDLPCKDGACPFKVDVENRFTDKDPGSPCPKFVTIYDNEITQQMFDDINRDADVRPSFWEPIVEKCKSNVR